MQLHPSRFTPFFTPFQITVWNLLPAVRKYALRNPKLALVFRSDDRKVMNQELAFFCSEYERNFPCHRNSIAVGPPLNVNTLQKYNTYEASPSTSPFKKLRQKEFKTSLFLNHPNVHVEKFYCIIICKLN